MNNINLESIIEAILFISGSPISLKRLAKITGKSETEVDEASRNLSVKLREEGRGIRLIKKEESVTLSTAPEAGDVIKELIKNEYDSKLSPASLETLTIIIYRSPINRLDIDYIRGVNSNFILRHLMIKGFVEKVTNPSDRRGFLYKPTFELLKFLGVEKIEDLPEYKTMREKVDSSLENKEKHEDKQENNNIGDIDSNSTDNSISGVTDTPYAA